MHPNVARLKERTATGVLPAMATPLDGSGYRVELDVVPALVDFLIEHGVTGIFAGGTTGEGILLPPDERCALHAACAAAVGGRVPLLVHIGANTTQETLALARHASQLSVDGVVCITPTFYGMPDEDLLPYFQEMAALAPDTPFLVYDIPQMAATGVSPSLLAAMAQKIPNFAGVKCSRPDAQVIRQLVDAAPDHLVYAGNERIALGSLALGTTGLISGLATAIPEPFVALAAAFRMGDVDKAQGEQRRINRLLDAMPSTRRIGAIKLILQQRGIGVGPAVPPRRLASEPDLWKRLSALL